MATDDPVEDDFTIRDLVAQAAFGVAVAIACTIGYYFTSGAWQLVLLVVGILSWLLATYVIGVAVIGAIMWWFVRDVGKSSSHILAILDSNVVLGLIVPAIIVLSWAPSGWLMGLDRGQWMWTGLTQGVGAALFFAMFGRRGLRLLRTPRQ